MRVQFSAPKHSRHDSISFNYISGGIIQHHCTNKNMNHAVQLIGYDLVSEQVPYWLAKNQWGRSFGEDGYVRIKYGENMCGKILYDFSTMMFRYFILTT